MRRNGTTFLASRTLIAITAAAGFVLATAVALDGAVVDRVTSSQASTTPGRVEVLHVTDGRTLWVYRPQVADSADLPVLYFLHGVPGSPGDVFTAGAMASALDTFIRAGGRPFVVAAVDGNGDRRGDTEWADAADGTDQVESFVTGEAITAVEGAHPRDAAHRAIAGFSMGGYGAMNIALRHRDLFGQVASFAGYFHVDDPDDVFAGQAGTIAANSPDQHVEQARGLHILLADGLNDANSVTARETQRYAAALHAAGIPATVLLLPGIGHDWSLVRTAAGMLAQFLADGWARFS